MQKFTILIVAILVLATAPAMAQSGETSVTAAIGGVFPQGTTFNAIPLNGLKAGFGIVIAEDGTAKGEFHCLLLGIAGFGMARNISLDGKATAGARTAAGVATFSGTCSVDLGDGTPPAVNVPFTVTVSTDANGQGSLGLVVGLTTLPNSAVNAGSITIQ